jgi:non-heme chloroperoxidase
MIMNKFTTILAASIAALNFAAPANAAAPKVDGSYITTRDDVRLYFKDWGPKSGPVVTFSHGWPLNADSWESQMQFLAERGFRVVAHDRRGHGRSSQPWDGNDMNHYADDLAQVIEALDLRDVTVVGFSTGGGEVARYLGRHGTKRVKKVVFIGAVVPFMLKTADNPNGVPQQVYDAIRKDALANRSQQYLDIAAGPFFGFNRAGAKPSQGLINTFYAQGMQAGAKNTFDSIAAFSATDFRGDLEKIDVPTLILHGEDDQLVPVNLAARKAHGMIAGSRLVVYPAAPHGITDTHKDQVNADLLKFLKE